MPANDQFWRPLSTLHKVSAFGALALLAATWLMMTRDHQDEWRQYQQTADELRAAKLNNQLSDIQGEEYRQKLAELLLQQEQAQQQLDEKQKALVEQRRKVAQIQGDVDLLARQTKFKGAELNVAKAHYDIAVRDGRPESELKALLERYNALQQRVDEMSLALERRNHELDQSKAALADSTRVSDKVDAQLKELRKESQRLSEALVNIAPGDDHPLQKFKRWLMLQPIVDGFNSPHGIKQEWLPDLPITLGMATTARFDRCRTCHVNINSFAAGNVPNYPHSEYPHPFSSHPHPDVYVTSSSPHPIATFGCTICHDGDGSGTSFQNAEHTPNNPAQAEQWHEEFGWNSNHFWEYPMQPERFIESTCIKCHHSVVELGINAQYGPTAPKVFEGYEIVKTYGCFGCHEINGFDGAKPIGPDLRLEPQTAEEIAKYEADPNQIAGRERKVGPSLRHVAAKMTPEFVAYWTELPSRFRPATRMPQFFHLSNQQDEQAERFQPVQLTAIAAFLDARSQPIELTQPQDGYEPSAERGKTAFAERGCLACHSHSDEMFAGAKATFGPDLSKVHEKIKPGPEGFNWVYTWIKDPTRHSARTKMPDLFLDPEGEGDNYTDPAADIAAFLLQGGPGEFPALDVDAGVVDELFALFARKSLTQENLDKMVAERAYPGEPASIKGDEIELARREGDEGTISDEDWQQRKLLYIGRRTISFYGCYGCHDIPGFEAARPIGTALQDWGRKDTSKLALEHIEEFLHHHGGGMHAAIEDAQAHEAGHGDQADAEHGPTVPEIAEEAIEREISDGDAGEADLSTAFFYENLQHHGRPGFLWQKLREPRSYDHRKTETKGYDERLRMPRFPFTDEQIEAVTTFVLGLVAEPPPAQYIFQPDQRKADIIEGERLLDKYNCGGCHMVDLPEIAFAANVEELVGSELGPADFEQALELLLKLKPPQEGLRRTSTGAPVTTPEGENIVEFKGLVFAEPDPEEDPEYQEYSYDLWETLAVNDKTLFPGSKMLVPAAKMLDRKPARGGDFAQWLVPHLMETQTEGNRFLAWQASPPPLYREGDKVQSPWLFEFLKNPDRLRFTTVLRMPKFNMTDDEARSLANYFAAVDGAVYPYQPIPQQQPPYLDAQQVAFRGEFPDDEAGYLTEAWNLLNAPLCIKCHSVGGNLYTSSDPKKDIRGPNLDRVAQRLRPDWTLLWLYKPAWITPYTSMPTVFPRNQTQLPELFGGDGQQQTVATRDALFNYYRLMEAHGPVAYTPEGTPQAPQAGSGGQ